MKNIFLFMLVGIIFGSCSREDNLKDSITGKWKLIETYNDPGDRSGDWVAVSENDSYTFQFNDDDTFTRSDVNCNGTYDYTQVVNSETYYVLTLDCSNIGTGGKLTLHFEGEYLILDGAPYSCDESCAKKFTRIE